MDNIRITWRGLLNLGGCLTGVIAVLASLLAIFNEYNYIGAGLCLLAAAFAFGLLARKNSEKHSS